MIVDTSAVVAVLFREPGFDAVLDKLVSAPRLAIGSPTLAETALVVSARLKRDGRGMIARFTQEASVAVVPFSEAHVATAVGAWLRFGKGRHRAALNFGDCLTYSVARIAEEPLLCVGNDFAMTDLEIA
ncbi:MAG: type II toxin-antitoxin system VapC family toxin [Deltaproteobacteria bacterium]|nr:type II toxin-antitoxin system VapC family toxin [Deltaproteobacteria bacterium]